MFKQLLDLRNYEDIPYSSIGKGWLTLEEYRPARGEGYYAGDHSGITVKITFLVSAVL